MKILMTTAGEYSDYCVCDLYIVSDDVFRRVNALRFQYECEVNQKTIENRNAQPRRPDHHGQVKLTTYLKNNGIDLELFEKPDTLEIWDQEYFH